MRRLGRWLLHAALPPLGFLAIVVALWQFATVVGELPVYLVPGPARVMESAREHAAELSRAVPLTGAAAMSGFLLSLMSGSVLGLLFSQSRLLQRSVYPYAIFLQTVPIVAIAPLLILWFGYGFRGVVAVSFILSLFPIITSATAGLTSVDRTHLELFAVHNATPLQVLFKLRLPSAVPYLVTGAKISCGLSVIGAIVGEIYAGFQGDAYGLGTLITRAGGNLDTAYVFAGVICSTLLSIAIFATVSLLGATILARWHATAPNDLTAEP
ncbi:MAG: ABC transporter permease [Planctomycetota bacterium]|nr:MAG: ABC transporter permease [Planctomycetota bacterium]